MLKRLISCILFFSLLLSAAGCSAMLQKEYLSISPYQDLSPDEQSAQGTQIQDYSDLETAIYRLVIRHEEQGKLKFNTYDGEVEADLALACAQIRTEDPLGAYVVDYISYDLSRIVSYYEANIYITYRRTQAEVDAIVSLNNIFNLPETMENAMLKMSDTLTVKVSSSFLNMDELYADLHRLYLNNPLAISLEPAYTIHMYPDSGLQKIIEFQFDYGFSNEELLEMRNHMQEGVRSIINQVVTPAGTLTDAQKAYSAFHLLSEQAEYDPDHSMRLQTFGASNRMGSTAYGALVDGLADSLGFAMAYKAISDALGIPCQVVQGHMDKQVHYWNIVEIDGQYYHADASQAALQGSGAVFLRSDEQFWGQYIWEGEIYPACPHPYYNPYIVPDPGSTETAESTGQEEQAVAQSPQPSTETAPEPLLTETAPEENPDTP